MSESASGTSLTVPVEGRVDTPADDAVPAIVSPEAAPPSLPRPRCQNCDAELVGPYCAACGQRHDPHLHSLPHFIAEAAENITHADSRLWRTLWALLAKPGFLTREFLVGRRASYLPPFRLYLVVTLLFFVILAALPSGDARLVNLEGASAQPAACKDLRYEGPGDSWLQPALTRACKTAALDGGRSLQEAFVHNVPRALFLFLPLLAAVMMMLYWRPRRYYVEHLLFFIHNHAGLFVMFGLYAIVVALVRVPGLEEWLGIGLYVYLLWYLYRAMRNVYGQSRARTIAKFMAIGFAYLVLGGITLLATGLYSAVTL